MRVLIKSEIHFPDDSDDLRHEDFSVSSLASGASVARVARAHGINANQVFGWRRLYLAGRLGEPKPGIKLLPVRVSESKLASVTVEHPATDVSHPQPGTIHIELPQVQVRIEGSADPALVRVLLECLRA